MKREIESGQGEERERESGQGEERESGLEKVSAVDRFFPKGLYVKVCRIHSSSEAAARLQPNHKARDLRFHLQGLADCNWEKF